jgi:hypothetical protein
MRVKRGSSADLRRQSLPGIPERITRFGLAHPSETPEGSTKEREAEESFLGLSVTTDAQQALWPLIQMQLPAAPDVDTWLCAVAGPCGAAADDVVAKWMTSPAAIASTTSVTAARARNTALGESWAVRS